MRFSAVTIFNCITVTGAASMMLVGAYNDKAYSLGSDGIDTMSTASVQAHVTAQPKALADRFTVRNHADGRSCIVKLHRAEGYNVHRIEPSENCAAVTGMLASARAWRENNDGLVAITDRSGKSLMKLIPGDGLAWEVIEPRNIALSLEAF
jgi:hypothetical protein